MTRETAAAAAGTPDATRIVGRDGRAKAYRPLPEAERGAAIEAGLAAYDRGDFFLAHEDLEPAWMGTADLGERAVLQGLIKLAAAYVHAVRGNPPGIQRNLVGARQRLAEPGTEAAAVAIDHLDLTRLIADIDRRLADLASHPNDPRLGPPVLRRSIP
jgi:predicted metal-dependent hydrolase